MINKFGADDFLAQPPAKDNYVFAMRARIIQFCKNGHFQKPTTKSCFYNQVVDVESIQRNNLSEEYVQSIFDLAFDDLCASKTLMPLYRNEGVYRYVFLKKD